MPNPKEITIDAGGKVLGRLASEIATILQGKNEPSFAPHKKALVLVRVSNVSKIRLTGKKPETKEYIRVSGYPGGLKRMKYSQMMKINPGWILKKAVLGMLPKNKLRQRVIKNLIIEEDTINEH